LRREEGKGLGGRGKGTILFVIKIRKTYSKQAQVKRNADVWGGRFTGECYWKNTQTNGGPGENYPEWRDRTRRAFDWETYPSKLYGSQTGVCSWNINDLRIVRSRTVFGE